MKSATLKSIFFIAILTVLFGCKKNDEGELDKTGASSTSPTEMQNNEMGTNEPENVSADTIGAGRDGMNGSAIGSGNPNTSGTADQTR
jgi:hypothetical protein